LHGLPQLLTSLDVQKRQAEENYREQQHRQILHRNSRYFMGVVFVKLGTKVLVGMNPAQRFHLEPNHLLKNDFGSRQV
jgi:hypothetical protein